MKDDKRTDGKDPLGAELGKVLGAIIKRQQPEPENRRPLGLDETD